MGEFDITEGIADSTGIHVPDSYTSFKPPAKGGTYVDSKFRTTIKRLTDGWTDIPNDGYTGEYGRPSHSNLNNSGLLVTRPLSGGFFVIDPSTLKVPNNLGIGGADEPIWDHSDPDIIWYNQGNQLKKYNRITNTHSVVATFNGTGGLPNYSVIEFGGGASDLSEDNDHIFIAGDNSKFGLYKISTNQYTPSPIDFSTTETGLYNGFVTYDNHVAVGFAHGHNPLAGTLSASLGSKSVVGVGTSFTTQLRQGSVLYFETMTGGTKAYVVSSVLSNTSLMLETPVTGSVSNVTIRSIPRYVLYDKNMNYLRVICKFTGHNTFGRDPSTGQEIMIIDGANSLTGLPAGCGGNGAVRFNLEDSSSSCVVGYPDFHLTGHYSFDNYRGHPWLAIVLYDGRVVPSETQPLAGTARLNAILRPDWASAWKRFYNEVFLVNIVTGEIRRLAHFRSRITGILGYWFTGRGSLSPDASQYTFSSNMNQFHHRTGRGTVSTKAGSNIVTGSKSPDAQFYSSTASVTLGGEITINGVTKIVTSILQDSEINSLTTDSAWEVDNNNVPYTAWNPDVTDLYRIGLRPPTTDFIPPVISNIKVSSITPASATVSWTTDKPSTSQVEWGTSTFYGGGITPYNPEKVTSHSANLTRLPSSQTIHFRVKSRDISGNIKLSPDQTFFTGGNMSTQEPSTTPTVPTQPTPSLSNVALAGNGATASASSTFGTQTPDRAINGDRKGLNSGWWADNTSNVYPDWIEVNFNSPKAISEISVFGLQQNPSSPVEPTPTMTSRYALTSFEVQYWTGSAWAAVPGGSVTGNDKVWRKFTFPALTTGKIRVWITSVAGDNRSQIVEIEAYAASDSVPVVPSPPLPQPTPPQPTPPTSHAEIESMTWDWVGDPAARQSFREGKEKEGWFTVPSGSRLWGWRRKL